MKTLATWNPFRELDEVQNRLGSFFGGSFPQFGNGNGGLKLADWFCSSSDKKRQAPSGFRCKNRSMKTLAGRERPSQGRLENGQPDGASGNKRYPPTGSRSVKLSAAVPLGNSHTTSATPFSKHSFFFFVLLGLSGLFVDPASAQIPQIINYQGRIVVNGTNFNGSGQFKFALVNASGSATFWSNDGTSVGGSQPTASVSSTVSSGLYSVQLGASPMQAIPGDVFSNPDVRLRVWFNDGTTGFQLLTPDQRIASVGYAMIASTVPDGAITWRKLADLAVGTSALADEAVTSLKILDGTIAAPDLATGAVTTPKLALLSVGTGQMADNAITSPKLALLAVGTSQLAEGGVTSAKILDGTVITADLADNSISSAKIQTGAVTSAKISDGTIANADLADNSVNSAKIQNGSVGNSDLSINSVTTGEIVDGTITANDIAASAIGTSQLANGAVTTAKLATVPAARVTRSSDFSVPTNQGTNVPFDGENFDTSNLHSTTVNPSRLTAPIAGIYQVNGSSAWALNSTGARSISLHKNGVVFVEATQDPVATYFTEQTISSHVLLAAGDYIELSVTQSSGAPLLCYRGNTTLSMVWQSSP